MTCKILFFLVSKEIRAEGKFGEAKAEVILINA